MSTDYDDHEYARLFPLMTDAELRELADDIRDNGLRDHIWIYEGKILDGRNRLRACRLADAEVRMKEYSGKNPLAFVISKNLHRRHLTESQRAMVAADLANAKRGGDRRSDQAANLPFDITHEKAARLLNVGERTVRDAVKVKEGGVLELADAVRKGDVPVSAAAKVAKLPKAEQRKAVKGGPAKVREAATKARTKDPAVIPTVAADAWGIPIQPHAEEAFAAVPKFKELVTAIQHVQRLFNECANLPGGTFLTLPNVSSYRRGKKGDDGEYADRFVHEGLEAALRQVRAAAPTHTVCPWHFVGAKHPEKCATCRDLNWTPVLGNIASKEVEAKVREVFGV